MPPFLFEAIQIKILNKLRKITNYFVINYSQHFLFNYLRRNFLIQGSP